MHLFNFFNYLTTKNRFHATFERQKLQIARAQSKIGVL